VERIEIWSPARWLETQKAARAPDAQAQLAARLHQLL
jgi:DNA-binding transcriptional regulator/RsmH inhibitor MraZ